MPEPPPDVSARVSTIETKLDGLIAAVDRQFEAVHQRFEAVHQRFEAVDQRFEAVDQRFEAVDRRFEAVDRRFEAVDRRFDGVERRLDRIEVVVEDIRDQVKLVAEGHAATQALVNRKFEEVVARFDRRVEPLELAVRHHSRVIEHHNLTEGSDPL